MTERQVALRRPILANLASQYRVLRNSLLIGIASNVEQRPAEPSAGRLSFNSRSAALRLAVQYEAPHTIK